MSRKCDLCGKGPTVGHNVSHSNRKTLRQFLPNLVTKKVEGKRTKLCTQCVRTMNKVSK